MKSTNQLAILEFLWVFLGFFLKLFLTYWISFSNYLLHIKMVYKFIRPIQYIYELIKYVYRIHIYDWSNIFMQTQHIYNTPKLYMSKINYLEVSTKCVFKMYIWLKLMTSQLYRKNTCQSHMTGDIRCAHDSYMHL